MRCAGRAQEEEDGEEKETVRDECVAKEEPDVAPVDEFCVQVTQVPVVEAAGQSEPIEDLESQIEQTTCETETASKEEDAPQVEEDVQEAAQDVTEQVAQLAEEETDVVEGHVEVQSLEELEAQIEQMQIECEAEFVQEAPEPAEEEDMIVTEEIVVEEVTEDEQIVADELPQVEDDNLQVEEPAEEPPVIVLEVEAVESVQEVTLEGETSLQLSSCRSTEDTVDDTESIQEATLSEDGGETIEEILESESVQEQQDALPEDESVEEATTEPVAQEEEQEMVEDVSQVMNECIPESEEVPTVEAVVPEEEMVEDEPQVEEEVTEPVQEEQIVQAEEVAQEPEEITTEPDVQEEMVEEGVTESAQDEQIVQEAAAEDIVELTESVPQVEEFIEEPVEITTETDVQEETVEDVQQVEEEVTEPVQEEQIVQAEEVAQEPEEITTETDVQMVEEVTELAQDVPAHEDAFVQEAAAEEVAQEKTEEVEEVIQETEEITADADIPAEEEVAEVAQQETQEEVTEDLAHVEESIQEPVAAQEESQEIAEAPEEVAEVIQEATEDVQPSEDEVQEEIVLQTALSHLQKEEARGRQGSEERRMIVNVCGMDVTAGMEDCGKMPSDCLPKMAAADKSHPHPAVENVPSVFLDAAIPPESHLVVSEAECSAEIVPADQLDLDEAEYETSPVVLSGKMTLSVIGMELNAEAPEIQEEPLLCRAEGESDTPRVRFPPQPTDRIFLIPVEPEEELIPEEEAEFRIPAEEEDEQADDGIVYRPPTPPLQHLVDHEAEEGAEFLTYDQLEQFGEVEDSHHPSLPECPVQFDTTIYPSDEDYSAACDPAEGEQSVLDAVESHIITAEESEAIAGTTASAADVSGDVEGLSAAVYDDEHAIIGEMVEKIRVAAQQLEEDGPEDIDIDALENLINEPQNVPVGQVVDEESVYQMEDVAPEACSEFLSDQIPNIEIENATAAPAEVEKVVEEMVDSIIASSVAESVLGAKCDTEDLIQQLSERINSLPDSGTEKILMEVEYQIIPTSSESTSVTGEHETSQDSEDFERNREQSEMEHALERVVPEVEIEAEPSISGFTIREDYPEEEEEAEPMTEEEILQARQEIEEIKKLLADVSSGVAHHATTGSIVSELAYVRDQTLLTI